MVIKNRYEFMYYVSCTNCNPNGDPDMGNTPRIDPQTMHGYITDVATKRRIPQMSPPNAASVTISKWPIREWTA